MSLSADATVFEQAGTNLRQGGLRGYLSAGLQREPLYPAMIAGAMSLAELFGGSYLKLLGWFQAGIIVLSMALLWRFLRMLGVRPVIVALCVGYFGISPAVVNSALSLFSEVAVYPFMLGLLFCSFRIQDPRSSGQWALILGQGILLGVYLLCLTMIKGLFELLGVLIILIVLWPAIPRFLARDLRSGGAVLLACVAGFVVFSSGVHGYKALNQELNGNYMVTDRGPWHFYGNAVRRVQAMDRPQLTAGLASVAGDGVCRAVVDQNTCDFWTFQKSDEIGIVKVGEYRSRGMDFREANHEIVKDAFRVIAVHPAAYAFWTFVEALKMFFWESTRIGFTIYPQWLTQIHENGLFKNGIRLFMSLLTIAAFVWALCVGGRRQRFIPFLVGVASVTILLQSLGSVLTRYAFPLIPVYMILIGLWLEDIIRRKEA